MKKIKIRNYIAIAAHFRRAWKQKNEKKTIPRKKKYKGENNG